jgi:hypothetical protein
MHKNGWLNESIFKYLFHIDIWWKMSLGTNKQYKFEISNAHNFIALIKKPTLIHSNPNKCSTLTTILTQSQKMLVQQKPLPLQNAKTTISLGTWITGNSDPAYYMQCSFQYAHIDAKTINYSIILNYFIATKYRNLISIALFPYKFWTPIWKIKGPIYKFLKINRI